MTDTLIDPQTSLADIVTEYPDTVSVFLKNDLDFCCGGKQTLAEACKNAGINEPELIKQLNALVEPFRRDTLSWAERPLNELIDHIVTQYHEPLRNTLPTLILLAERVERAHGPTQGQRLTELRKISEKLETDMLKHLKDEEERLFRMILNGDGASIPETLDQLVADHEEVGEMLARIRVLTDEYRLPEDACVTWRTFWRSLETLERETKQHVHLENNVLFPRALHTLSDANAA